MYLAVLGIIHIVLYSQYNYSCPFCCFFLKNSMELGGILISIRTEGVPFLLPEEQVLEWLLVRIWRQKFCFVWVRMSLFCLHCWRLFLSKLTIIFSQYFKDMISLYLWLPSFCWEVTCQSGCCTFEDNMSFSIAAFKIFFVSGFQFISLGVFSLYLFFVVAGGGSSAWI